MGMGRGILVKYPNLKKERKLSVFEDGNLDNFSLSLLFSHTLPNMPIGQHKDNFGTTMQQSENNRNHKVENCTLPYNKSNFLQQNLTPLQSQVGAVRLNDWARILGVWVIRTRRDLGRNEERSREKCGREQEKFHQYSNVSNPCKQDS